MAKCKILKIYFLGVMERGFLEKKQGLMETFANGFLKIYFSQLKREILKNRFFRTKGAWILGKKSRANGDPRKIF